MQSCPNCHKENPSAANHCMYCGTLLIEETLSEEDKLRAKLQETEKENRLLKEALEAQLKTGGSKVMEQHVPQNPSVVSDSSETQLTETDVGEKVQEKDQNKDQEKVKTSSFTGWDVRKFFREYWSLLLVFLIIPGLIIVLSNTQIKRHSTENVLEESTSHSEKKKEEESVEERVKSFVVKYCELTETGSRALVYELYAPFVKRYHDAYNIDVSDVADKYANYDKKFGVYGKHSNVRWNTLSYEKEGDVISVQYVEDYTIDRHDDSKYSIFVLEKHLELNREYRIVSVYEIQLSKSKKQNHNNNQLKSRPKPRPKPDPIPVVDPIVN